MTDPFMRRRRRGVGPARHAETQLVVSPIGQRELLELLHADEPVILVEALGPMYYDDVHLPGALNLPHDEVHLRAPQLLVDRQALVVTYSSGPSCDRAALAARALMRLGYSKVRVYSGGKQEWIEAGHPVERPGVRDQDDGLR